MAQFTPKPLYRGCHHLATPVETTCTTAGTYYKIGGSWTDGEQCNNGFVYDGAGKITYISEDGVFALFNSTSDLKSSKVATVTYALYLNGALVANNETPTTFEHANSLRNISLSNVLKLHKGDYFEVYVKSDVASNIITSNTLYITFLGDR